MKFEAKIKLDVKDNDLNYKDYILKNYLTLISEIFNFVFKYKFEKEIHYKGLSIVDNKSQKIEIPNIVITSMRMKDNKNIIKDISQDWLDFPLI